MKLLQIALGTVPPLYAYWMAQWQEAAAKHDCACIMLTDKDIPEYMSKAVYRETVADVMRASVAATEPYLLYVDWDVELKSWPDLGDEPMFDEHNIEAFFWTGAGEPRWNTVLNRYSEYRASCPTWPDERNRVHKIVRDVFAGCKRFTSHTDYMHHSGACRIATQKWGGFDVHTEAH